MNAKQKLYNLHNEEKAKHLSCFFKTGPGEYAEHDQFLGIPVPLNRKIAKEYYKITSIEELQDMLNSEYHEIRLCALLMMVLKYEKTDIKEKIVKLYCDNVKQINNWDLVDLTAHKIIGAEYIRTKIPNTIIELANSKHLWSERIAIVSQWSVIKTNDFSLIIKLCEKFLSHKHDLIHKATGWMLREVGKQNENVLIEFLNKHHKNMPRTALRYSIVN